jgi:hypothetical protein
MPVFCYTWTERRRGQKPLTRTVRRTFSIGRARVRIQVGGKCYVRDIPAEWAGRPDANACWPKKSDALGVLHSQVGEAAEHLADNGVPTQFCQDGTGRCIVESNDHQNRIMRVLRIHDRDACYSQRTRP